ncbi:MAG: DEAD/DEAH box helicase, partial [Chloroflexi bacterium]|nr:DEAD/DEAH box helicase [Chloroflexota bacterium]
MHPDEFLTHLRSLPDYQGQIVHVERLLGRPPTFASLERPLAPAVQAALEARGIDRFYSHQVQAIDAVRAGEHVMVATGTASGKTLCYNVPVLETLALDPLFRALYLFPTKALAQDQLRALRELLTCPSLRHIRVGVYDGDTPQAARSRVRRQSTILFTNPDMLSVGILPHHPLWRPFLQRLKYVVLDEAHVYRGVFGSHVACLIRRLRRLCARYGAEPQFILCSATIANPEEHAVRLIGERATVVDQDGAPQGPRHFVLWNPPYIDRLHGVRASINGQASQILVEMVKKGLRNITFVRA